MANTFTTQSPRRGAYGCPSLSLTSSPLSTLWDPALAISQFDSTSRPVLPSNQRLAISSASSMLLTGPSGEIVVFHCLPIEAARLDPSATVGLFIVVVGIVFYGYLLDSRLFGFGSVISSPESVGSSLHVIVVLVQRRLPFGHTSLLKLRLY